MIVIPAVDIRGGRAVRLTRGRPENERVYAEDPAEVAERFAREGAAWLHVVDLDAALGSGRNREAVRRTVAAAGIPVQVGGGLRSIEAVEETLTAGAERVVLGTEAVTDPEFLRLTISRFGERVVVSVDTEGDRAWVRGWTEEAGTLDDALERVAAAGAPRLLVTSVNRDGTMTGPDVDLYRRVLASAGRPVLAAGGVRSADDLRALADAGVEGVIVGTALYEGTLTVAEAVEVAG